MGYRDCALALLITSRFRDGFRPDPKVLQAGQWELSAHLLRALEFRTTCMCSSEGWWLYVTIMPGFASNTVLVLHSLIGARSCLSLYGIAYG